MAPSHLKYPTAFPYGAKKCNLLRSLAGDLAWLACFGDSELDFEMLD
jgi:hypothetical protein